VATGIARSTINRGIDELQSARNEIDRRVRRPGAGRKSAVAHQPSLPAALEEVIEAAIRGDPCSPLRWVSRSQRQLVKPNFRTLTVSTAAKPQNSAVLLDGDRIVVLKIRCPFGGFSILTGSATVCWHSGLRRASRSTGRRKSRLDGTAIAEWAAGGEVGDEGARVYFC
jgi:hypothetical protein